MSGQLDIKFPVDGSFSQYIIYKILKIKRVTNYDKKMKG